MKSLKTAQFLPSTVKRRKEAKKERKKEDRKEGKKDRKTNLTEIAKQNST